MKIKLNQETFIKKAIEVHNSLYDYSKTEYVNSRTKIRITCTKHGEFWQKPSNHLRGQGCSKCQYENKSKKMLYTNNNFKELSNKIHNNKYDYSKVEYKHSQTKVCIICPEHGEFWQVPNDHLRGYGCIECSETKGEKRIKSWLNVNNIEYITQKTFDDLYILKSNCKLRFDFYLPKYNLLIEYDGAQHFRPFSWSQDKSKETMRKNLEIVKQRDQIKNQYCENNNIRLLRIPFSKYRYIEKILNEILGG